MMKRLIGWVALVLALCAAPSVWAQSPQDIEKAQEHFRKGAEWFAGGEYAKAIVEFTSGHALAPNAMFLYNVSLCYERLENIDSALGAAQRATEYEGMPDEVAVRNKARIHAFRVILDSQDVARDFGRVASTDTTSGEGDGDIEVTQQTETRPDGITFIGWSGLALAAVGTGFIIGGVATNSAVVKEIEDYEAAAAANDRNAFETSRDRIEKQQTQGKIFYGIGFAAAGLGAALFVVDLLTGTEEVPVAVIPDPSGGASIQARFHF